jgi:hypothetical protein
VCGMLMNPMYVSGGYILDESGHFIDPNHTPHFPVPVANLLHFFQDNWRVSLLWLYLFLCVCLQICICYVCVSMPICIR